MFVGPERGKSLDLTQLDIIGCAVAVQTFIERSTLKEEIYVSLASSLH